MVLVAPFWLTLVPLLVLGSAGRPGTALTSRRVSFNFDTGPIIVHTNCSCGTYTFHEAREDDPGDGGGGGPTYSITTRDIAAVADRFDALTTDQVQHGEEAHEDLVFINVLLNNTESQQETTLADFAAVLPSQESNFKYLPFKMVDIESILRMTRLPSLRREKNRHAIDVSVSDVSDRALALRYQRENTTTLIAKDLDAKRQNLLITILFFAVSFNNLDMDEKYEVCVASRALREAPLLLHR